MDKKLLEFCNTEFQKKCVKQAIKHDGKSYRWQLASKEIDAPAEKIRLTVRNVRRRASKRGWSPEHDMDKVCPSTFDVTGVSTYYDKEGQVTGQWVKTKANGMFHEVLYETLIEELRSNEIHEKALNVTPPVGDDSLLNLYTITDYHIGMMAWAEETGAEWNRDIAYNTFVKATRDMVDRSPSAKYGFLNILGDFIHTDGNSPVTPANKHVLDAETRYKLLVRYTIRMLRTAVDILRRKHEVVYLLVAEGNHDENSSTWCQEMLDVFYENSPNIIVIKSASPYYAHDHGDTMLAFHHGHKANMNEFAEIVPAQFRKMWGNAEYCYGHMGHLHHKDVKEKSGIIIEQHQTLSAKDAYSARGGYFSERGATCITYCKKQGEYSRITVRP